MSLTLELPQALEEALKRDAAKRGLSLADYALQLLSRERLGNEHPTSGRDLVAYWHSEGVTGMRTDIVDTQSHARRLRREAEQRHRE
jgi:hypothetical protein